MFYNIHVNKSISIKWRITLPSRYREEFKNNTIYMISLFDNINQKFIYCGLEESISNLINKNSRLENVPISKEKIDDHGRFLVPQYYRDIFKESKECTMLGQGDHFLIYNPTDEEVILKSFRL